MATTPLYENTTFIYPFINPWTFGLFPPLTVVNHAAVNSALTGFVWTPFSVPLDAYVVNCWIKVLSQSLAIWGRAKFFSRMTTLLYIPTNKIGGGFQFFHIPANICHFHWKKCLFYSLFIYLAVLGVSWGMWDLVPWPEVEPRLRALGVRSVSHWPTREVLILIVFLNHPKWVWISISLWFDSNCFFND